MIISTDENLKKNFSIQVGEKTLTHQKKITVLGNIITEDLTWDSHIKSLVIPSLANRARSLKLTTKYMDKKI